MTRREELLARYCRLLVDQEDERREALLEAWRDREKWQTRAVRFACLWAVTALGWACTWAVWRWGR
jgi:type VI protein secretion system component VasF